MPDPATELDGQWVRPHDLVVHRHPGLGGQSGRVDRVTHLGFEVRVDVRLDSGGSTWVQLGRGASAELGLAPDDPVWINRTGATADQPSWPEFAHDGTIPGAV